MRHLDNLEIFALEGVELLLEATEPGDAHGEVNDDGAYDKEEEAHH